MGSWVSKVTSGNNCPFSEKLRKSFLSFLGVFFVKKLTKLMKNHHWALFDLQQSLQVGESVVCHDHLKRMGKQYYVDGAGSHK